ncbi:MAG TPA: hemerythrin domain-containing protein [Polyangiaceae bacterium]|nr:hemerythrin domain-containing protein [Polyangiaceae bacterium]
MARMISNGIDVVTFLKEQHQQIKAGFKEVLATSGEPRRTAFYALRRLLAVHETAEEEIVHPAARKALSDGESVVQARLEEENAAKQVLSQLEDMDVDSMDFEVQFTTLQASVIAHAEAEEMEEFDRLGNQMEPERLQKMRKAVTFAESIAPTRPHPGVESAAANMLAGPFASMLDRARDALTGKA